MPYKLYNVGLTVYNSSYCGKTTTSLQTNWSAQFCAGNYSGGQDTCQGDSGGGVYSFNSTINKFILSGITRSTFLINKN